MSLKNMLVSNHLPHSCSSFFCENRASRKRRLRGLFAFSLVAGLLFSGLSASVFAQSSDNSGESAAPDPQALIEELEQKLEAQKKELAAVIEQRDATRDEQQEIREALESEAGKKDTQAQKLLELCQKYNSESTGATLDCEKELGG